MAEAVYVSIPTVWLWCVCCPFCRRSMSVFIDIIPDYILLCLLWSLQRRFAGYARSGPIPVA
jgi:hypothetical protein